MLLASISVAVSKWVLVRGRSCGSQQNYVQVRDALYGTNPYYRTISLCPCCTHITRKQEEAGKHGLPLTILIKVLLVVHVAFVI